MPSPTPETDSSTTAVAELGLAELIAIGVGGMIGGGIFSVLGMAVEIAGPAAPLAFVVGALVALAAGYSYVKLALCFHSDGASFTYLEQAFPEAPFVASVAGWTVIVGYVGTLALYAYTFGAYAAHLLGTPGSAPLRMALSSGVLLVFMAVNLRGAKATGRAEDLIVYVKIILLALFAVAGSFTVQSGHLVEAGSGVSIGDVLVASATVFVAFEGFQLITNAVCETRSPERDVPRGIYGSIAITGIIYLCVAVVAIGSLGIQGLIEANEYALAVAAEPALGRAGALLVDLAALLATASAINATAFGASRMLAEMASEERVPLAFSFRSRSQVPWLAVVVLTVAAVAFTLIGSLEIIAIFSSLVFLLVSISVSAANLRLWKRTGSNTGIVVAGMLLMSAAVVLLILHLYREQSHMLWVILALLFGVALLSVGFLTFHRRRRTGS